MHLQITWQPLQILPVATQILIPLMVYIRELMPIEVIILRLPRFYLDSILNSKKINDEKNK